MITYSIVCFRVEIQRTIIFYVKLINDSASDKEISDSLHYMKVTVRLASDKGISDSTHYMKSDSTSDKLI